MQCPPLCEQLVSFSICHNFDRTEASAFRDFNDRSLSHYLSYDLLRGNNRSLWSRL